MIRLNLPLHSPALPHPYPFVMRTTTRTCAHCAPHRRGQVDSEIIALGLRFNKTRSGLATAASAFLPTRIMREISSLYSLPTLTTLYYPTALCLLPLPFLFLHLPLCPYPALPLSLPPHTLCCAALTTSLPSLLLPCLPAAPPTCHTTSCPLVC